MTEAHAARAAWKMRCFDVASVYAMGIAAVELLVKSGAYVRAMPEHAPRFALTVPPAPGQVTAPLVVPALK